VVGGLSALGAGLFSIGIPKNSVLEYETAVKSDKVLLLIIGTASIAQGAVECLFKPFSESALLNALNAAVGGDLPPPAPSPSVVT